MKFVNLLYLNTWVLLQLHATKSPGRGRPSLLVRLACLALPCRLLCIATRVLVLIITIVIINVITNIIINIKMITIIININIIIFISLQEIWNKVQWVWAGHKSSGLGQEGPRQGGDD